MIPCEREAIQSSLECMSLSWRLLRAAKSVRASRPYANDRKNDRWWRIFLFGIAQRKIEKGDIGRGPRHDALSTKAARAGSSTVRAGRS
jgi:hypothetical protein